MDQARYYTALLLLMTAPGGTLYWFSIHPFIHFWRQIGPRVTIALHLSGTTLLAMLFLLARRPLLAIEYGTRPVLIGLGLALLAVSVTLRIKVLRHLTKPILMGVPELAPDLYPAPLLTKGPFARVRNPRYLQILIAILAFAVFSNYLAAYIVFAACVLILRGVIHFEEEELRERFGRQYEEYCARVPRLIPKLRQEKSS